MKVLGHFNHAHAPNESTTPALSARGARRAALGSGPWGQPCAFQLFGLGSVTPGSWSLVRGTAGCTKTRHLFYTSDLLTY